ncbi:MAG TPA: hypothetical protein VFA52_02665 [Candidatus Paceibacterota bacterium]|nr:hypothetical protein [Candidatus Paceibacterota bacterium]
MPRLIEGAGYSRATDDLHVAREEQHPCDVSDRDESWEEAARNVRKMDPHGTQSLKLLRKIIQDASRPKKTKTRTITAAN